MRVQPDSMLYRWVNQTELEVNSTHHQYIDQLGENLIASATAPDGVVEALELKGDRFAVGVQWHPESLEDPAHHRIYQGLVEACT